MSKFKDAWVIQPPDKDNPEDSIHQQLKLRWGVDNQQRWVEVDNILNCIDHLKSVCEMTESNPSGNYWIRRLFIKSHGNNPHELLGKNNEDYKYEDYLFGSFRIGWEKIYLGTEGNPGNLHQPWIKSNLEKMRPFFQRGQSLVILDSCYTGYDQRLLKELSKIWGGVAVMAAETAQTYELGDPPECWYEGADADYFSPRFECPSDGDGFGDRYLDLACSTTVDLLCTKGEPHFEIELEPVEKNHGLERPLIWMCNASRCEIVLYEDHTRRWQKYVRELTRPRLMDVKVRNRPTK